MKKQMIKFNFNAFFFDLAEIYGAPMSKVDFAEKMDVGKSSVTMMMQRGTVKPSFYNQMRDKFRKVRVGDYRIKESVSSRGQRSVAKVSA